MVSRASIVPFFGGVAPMARDPLEFLRQAATCGEIVDLCLPRRTYLLTRPEDIERVLLPANRSVMKDAYLRDLQRVVGTGLLTSEGDFWRRQRRLAQPAFHRDRLGEYADEMVASTVRALAALPPGETLDVHAALMTLTLEIVTRTLFGSDIGADAARVGDALDVVLDRYASVLPFVVPGFDHLPLKRNVLFRDAVRTLRSVVGGLVAARRAAPVAERRDLLSMLLAATDEDGAHMTDAELGDEVMTLMLAGHETTANALSWALVLLARNPAVEARLASTVAGELGGREPTLDDVPRLAFVEHVVTEAMRLYPPAWAVGREVTTPFEVQGVRLRAGTQLWMPQCVVHRDPRFFDEPDAFRPERWEGGLAKRLPRFAYFPFGGGPRVCIGNAFAMMELVLVLTTLIQRRRFELAPGERATPLPTLTLRPRGGLRMIVREGARS